MLNRLSRAERMRLMKFVCSFAWMDLTIQSEERAFVARMIQRLELDDDDREQVESWLEAPPSAEEIDPTSIPSEHRKIFVRSIEGVIAADGEISMDEREALSLLEELLVS